MHWGLQFLSILAKTYFPLCCFSCILNSAILVGTGWYLRVFLMCIFPSDWDVEAFFLCFWLLCISFGEMALQILCPCLNWVIFLPWSCKSSLYTMDTRPLSEKWLGTIFLPFCGLPFHFLNSARSLTKSFKVQFIYFFPLVSFSLSILTPVYWASSERVNVPLGKLLILPELHFPHCSW